MKSRFLRLASLLGALACLFSSFSARAGTYGYAALPEKHSVVVFNAQNPQSGIISEVKFSALEYPQQVLSSPDGTRVMVLTRTSYDNKSISAPSNIYIFQRSGWKLLSKLSTNSYLSQMWVDENWTRLFVKSSYYHEISLYKMESDHLTLWKSDLINLGDKYFYFALSRDGKTFYLAEPCTLQAQPKDPNLPEDSPTTFKCYMKKDAYGTYQYLARIWGYYAADPNNIIYGMYDIKGTISSISAGPDNKSLYVATDNYYVQQGNSSKNTRQLLRIDMNSKNIVQQSLLNSFVSPVSEIIPDPQYQNLYLANSELGEVADIVGAFDAYPLSFSDSIQIGNAIPGYGPYWGEANLAVHPDGYRLYRASAKNKNISFIDSSDPKNLVLIGKLALPYASSSIAISPDGECGNQVVENQEQCDGGFNCKADCTVFGLKAPVCGDGVVEASEECDDGDLISGNGCSATCQLEKGKAVPPPLPQPVCGNAKLEKNEECDDGNLLDGDGCDASCAVEEAQPDPQPEPDPQDPIEPVCGNHVLEQGEECDDGNLINGDACAADCRVEIPEDKSDPVCGNQILEAGEECDGGFRCDVNCKKIIPDENEGGGCNLSQNAGNPRGLFGMGVLLSLLAFSYRRKAQH